MGNDQVWADPLARPDPLAEPEGYGRRIPAHLLQPARPHQEPSAEEAALMAGHKPDTLCAADRKYPASPPVCDREFTVTWRVGDAAEHIIDIELCAGHSDALAVQVATGTVMRCSTCGQPARVEQILDRETGEDTGYASVLEAARSKLVQAALDRLAGDVRPGGYDMSSYFRKAPPS